MDVHTLTSGPTSAAVVRPDAGEDPDFVRPQVEKLLLDHGAVLLRGFEVDSAARFHGLVSCFGEPFSQYVHGNSPRTAVREGVWTSTDYPAAYDISLHNELSNAFRWPSRLFFCCLIAPERGGETPVSDGRALLADMDPAVRRRFEARGVAYKQRMHGGFGLGKSWQECYETDDRDQVEAYLREADVEFRWTDDGDLVTRQVRPATRVHPATGAEVWFNQADQYHPSNLPAAEARALLSLVDSEDELPLSVTYGDGSPIPEEDLAHVRELSRRNECAFRWTPGDVLVIDNMLVMHGRHGYAGPRRVLVAMT